SPWSGRGSVVASYAENGASGCSGVPSGASGSASGCCRESGASTTGSAAAGSPVAGAAGVSSSHTQNCHPSGAGGHAGSGCHPSGGVQPSGGAGQPGAGLKRYAISFPFTFHTRGAQHRCVCPVEVTTPYRIPRTFRSRKDAEAPALSHAVKPPHGYPGTGVTEGFQFIVPGLSKCEVEFPTKPGGICRVCHRRADTIFRHNHVAMYVGLGVKDP